MLPVRAVLCLVAAAGLGQPAVAAPPATAEGPAPSVAEVVPTPVAGMAPEQVIFTRDLTTRQPALSFGLAEKVYLVMTWKGLLEGPHTLRVSWTNPRGRVAEETLYSFVVLGRTVKYDTWVWMQVKPPETGQIYDYAEVLGDWSVKGYLDGVGVIDSGFRLERELPPVEGGIP